MEQLVEAYRDAGELLLLLQSELPACAFSLSPEEDRLRFFFSRDGSLVIEFVLDSSVLPTADLAGLAGRIVDRIGEHEADPCPELSPPSDLLRQMFPKPKGERMSDFQAKAAQVLEVAEDLFQRTTSWEFFFREIFSVQGAIHRLFPSHEERERFRGTEQYARLDRMRSEISRREESRRQPRQVITVRMPRSLHEALKAEAHQQQTSLNQLCLRKLERELAG